MCEDINKTASSNLIESSLEVAEDQTKNGRSALLHVARFFRGRLTDFISALTNSGVLLGLAGTILITLGSLTPAYLPSNSPWWKLLKVLHLTGRIPAIIGTLMVLLGVGCLVVSWLKLRPFRGKKGAKTAYLGMKHWAVLLVWSLPFLLAPPIFSHDAYSYAAQGWLLHNDIDPYYVGPGVLPGRFADQVSWVWRYTPAPYGPLSLRIAQWLVELLGFNPYWAAVAQRIPALVGVGLIGFFLPRIAHRMKVDPAGVAWFGVLNPLLVIDFVGGAHNDSLMMGLVMLGLWMAFKTKSRPQMNVQSHSCVISLSQKKTRNLFSRFSLWVQNLRLRNWSWLWWILGAAVIGLAATIKQPALLAVYAVSLIDRPWNNWKLRTVLVCGTRMLASFLVAGGVFVGISLATGLDFGWYNAIDVPGKVVTVSPFTLAGQGIQIILDWFHLDQTGHLATTVLRGIGLVFAGGFLVWGAVTFGRKHPITYLAWGYIVVALCTPALHSWYMLWGGLLLPLTAPKHKIVRIAIWGTVVLLCYATVNLSWRNNALALGVGALAGFWWIVAAHNMAARRIAKIKE